MRSKAVNRRLKSIRSLRSMLGKRRDRLNRRPRAECRPDAGFRHGQLFDDMDSDLVGLGQDLEHLEEAASGALDRIAGVRRERDRSLSALYRRQARARRLLGDLLGSRRALRGLIAPARPKSALELAREVLRTMDFLRRCEGPVPQPIVGLEFDAQALAADLDADLEDLLVCAERLTKTVDAATAARRRADAAGAEFDRAQSSIVRDLVSLCRLARSEARSVQLTASEIGWQDECREPPSGPGPEDGARA